MADVHTWLACTWGGDFVLVQQIMNEGDYQRAVDEHVRACGKNHAPCIIPIVLELDYDSDRIPNMTKRHADLRHGNFATGRKRVFLHQLGEIRRAKGVTVDV